MKACFQIAECSLFYAKIRLSGLLSKGETINIRMVFPTRVRIFRTRSFFVYGNSILHFIPYPLLDLLEL